MSLQLIGLIAAWLASVYRLWVSFRQPSTIWRTAFTAGIVGATLGVTFQTFSPQIDSWTGPSVGSLLNHLVVIVGLASVQIYLATLRTETPPPGLLRRVAVVALLGEVVAVFSWVLAAPFHSGEAEHFAVYATNVWVSIYFLTFWSLIAVTMVAVAKFCLLEQRGAPPEDRARVVSLTLIGLGACAGVLYSLAAAAGTIYIVITQVADDGALMASTRLIGPAVGLLGAGILALLVVPSIDAPIRVRRRLRALRPLWDDLQRVAPEVRLKDAERDRLTAPAAAERAVIEIRDALNLVAVEAPGEPSVGALARRLHEAMTAPGGGRRTTDHRRLRPAGTFMPHSVTQREDSEQVYALAVAYRRARDEGRRPVAPEPTAVPNSPA